MSALPSIANTASTKAYDGDEQAEWYEAAMRAERVTARASHATPEPPRVSAQTVAQAPAGWSPLQGPVAVTPAFAPSPTVGSDPHRLCGDRLERTHSCAC
ncbi:MAG: hypothetical protein WCI05_13565, partial [Myxococcales bacterium]